MTRLVGWPILIGCVAAASALAETTPREDVALLIEPGPAVTVVNYADGATMHLPSAWHWRPMCGSVAMTRAEFVALIEPLRNAPPRPAGGDRHARGSVVGGSGCGPTIIFNIDGSVPAAAANALQDVADYFSETFSDNVTFSINVGFAGLPGGVIGATSNSFLNVAYSTTRANLQVGMDPTDTLQNFLPPGGTVPVRYNGSSDTVTNETSVIVSRANYVAAIGNVGGISASMTFNANFPFDYVPSNGVPCSQFDFQSVVAHEVGHAMGFTSNADVGTPDMSMLDLFRFQWSDSCAGPGDCDYNPDSLTEFETTPRLVDFNNPNDNVISDIGIGEWRMEDGSPSQASHFRESVNALMDPALSFCQSFWPNFLNSPDLNMFDAIGWDYPPDGPCSDGDPCTVDDLCNGVSCSGAAVDCTAAGGECTVASCDPAGTTGNCGVIVPANNGGPCNGGAGICQNGACADVGDRRTFAAAPGAQGAAPTSGPTTLTLIAGGTAAVEVWVADTANQAIGGYQFAMAGAAQPQPGATGTVGYLDLPGGSGASLAIDTQRSDWLFAGLGSVDVFLTEAGLPAGFAATAVPPFGSSATVDGLRYLGEFELTASANALGTFELPFLYAGDPPNGGTTLVDHTGANPIAALLQPLHVIVIDAVECADAAACGDADGDTIADDACLWSACIDTFCEQTDRRFADAGGVFGACPVDGAISVHDRNLVLLCFAGSAPCDAINLDVGGSLGSCSPDGACDVHDVEHVAQAFADTSPCTCPGGPAPAFDPDPVGATGLTIMSRPAKGRSARRWEVAVATDGPIARLAAYQLALEITGGSRGAVGITDVRVEPTTLAPNITIAYQAHNPGAGRTLAGLDPPSTIAAGSVLATFTVEATPDAAGEFVVDVAMDARSALLAGPRDAIAIRLTAPAVIAVDAPHQRR